jgi:serine/threonine-protein kinase RsbW
MADMFPGRRVGKRPAPPAVPECVLSAEEGYRAASVYRAHPDRTFASEYGSEVLVLPLIREQLDGLLETVDIDREKRWDIRLAVTEACSNAIRHAYPDSGGTFQVAADITSERLTVTVRDAGCGATEHLVPRLGMLLVHEAADAVTLEDANPGLIVRMSFSLG